MATTPLTPDLREERIYASRSPVRDRRRVRLGSWWLITTVAAGALAAILAYFSLRPVANHMVALMLALAESGALALALGMLALDLAQLRALRHVWLKLALPPVVTALVIAVTIGTLSQGMFISSADSHLLLVFLVFAVALALALAGTLAVGMGCAIGQLETGARRIAEGDYAYRVPVPDGGVAATDELMRLAGWFNLMAGRIQDAFARREAAEAERKHVVAALSHDLRTPITSLRAMLEAIDDGVVRDPVTVARYHHAMRSELVRMSALMDELFEMARLDAGAMPPQRELMGIDDLISDALEAFHGPALKRSVRLTGFVAEGLPVAALDPRQISRALANLLQNALRYTPAGGAVMVRARAVLPAEAAGCSALVVEVLDTGMGIGKEDLPNIFERSFRSEAARNRPSNGPSGELPVPGAGLGLAITRAIVEQHGGRVWAISPLPAELRGEVEALLDPTPAKDVVDDDSDDDAGDETSGQGTLVAFTLPVWESA
jgi:signal transduction histidine kinase